MPLAEVGQAMKEAGGSMAESGRFCPGTRTTGRLSPGNPGDFPAGKFDLDLDAVLTTIVEVPPRKSWGRTEYASAC